VPENRIAYIDGLRALAVLIVVASHALPGASFGQVGVELFFVISGFCLSYPTLAKMANGDATFDVHRYVARRLVRIVPPYWIAVVLLFSLALLIPGLHRVSVGQAFQQAFFIDRNVDFLSGSFWTLPIEFRWYFIFPLALVLWTKSPKSVLWVALIAAVVGALLSSWTYDVLELPGFLLGIAAAHVTLHEHRIAKPALPLFCILALAAVAIAPTFDARLWHTIYFIPLLEAAMFLFVVSAGTWAWLHRVLSVKWLTGLGLASYSVYLIHAPVIGFAVAHHVNFWLASLLGIMAGLAFWYVAERPFADSKLRDQLVSRIYTWSKKTRLPGALAFLAMSRQRP
jgi:peptidoglycan/LPS O-acetylase OafA/YrhL